MKKWSTQPMCQSCWDRQNPWREAAKLVDPDPETCAWCEKPTRSGIYVRTATVGQQWQGEGLA